MTDRELLESVSAKLDTLSARVDAVEAAAAGAVSHDEVAAVVDAETSLEGRVTALEAKFSGAPVPENPSVPEETNPVVTEPLVLTAEPQPETTDEAPPSDSHVIS